jgi:ABC-type transport system substrate-binding protein
MRALLLAAGMAVAAVSAHAQGTVTVAMTAGDLPVTIGVPDQGFEGNRFVGLNIYDALTGWDLSKADGPKDLEPKLATSWNIDPSNNKRWIFHLREGVKFHDGCDFTADDVVWNYKRYTSKEAEGFDALAFALARQYMLNVETAEALDPHTVAVTMKSVDSLFPYPASFVPIISQCRARAVGFDWQKYATQPSGTGPYRFASAVAHERMVLDPNKDYWDKTRIPKQDHLVLVPMPEASTRVAALLSGQVNFIEAPPPDAIPRLKSSGMTVVTNAYPHNSSYQLNFVSSPFKDVRVRRAANYAINRADVVELLNGVADEGYSTIPPMMPFFGHPVLYKYDPNKATALLKEAGCYPCAVSFAISTSGSGQMQPLPMNELVKSQLEQVGFKVDLQVMDWNALLDVGRGGIDKFGQYGGINITRSVQDPFNGLIRFVAKSQWAPAGSNWGHYEDAESETLIAQINSEFDPVKRNAMLEKLNERMNDQAVMIWVAHDVNPRALSPKLHGFVQAQSWLQDLTPITVSP